jgi:hypothetical protein
MVVRRSLRSKIITPYVETTPLFLPVRDRINSQPLSLFFYEVQCKSSLQYSLHQAEFRESLLSGSYTILKDVTEFVVVVLYVGNSKSKDNSCTNCKQSEMDTTVTQAEPELTSSLSATSDTVIRRSSRMTVLARFMLP